MTWDLPAVRRESRIEWQLWLAVAGLMLVGSAFIFSATGTADAAARMPWWRFRVVGQVLAYLLGIGLVAVLCLVDYSRLARWSLVAYWISIVLLLAVTLFGVSRLGARRWLDFGMIQFQPSELVKLTFLFALANFLSRPPGELASPALFAKALGMTLLPFGLILKQPDLGSALVFLPVALTMMFVAGVPRRFLARFLGGGAFLVALILVDVLYAPPGWRFEAGGACRSSGCSCISDSSLPRAADPGRASRRQGRAEEQELQRSPGADLRRERRPHRQGLARGDPERARPAPRRG
ncbi:MAG: FtsW/RodA/SpoVE family cell cycle protein [Verrucomicrobiota bacterium]